MSLDRAQVQDLLAEYGALLDAEQYDDWLALFAAECCYHVVPRENWQRGLPAGHSHRQEHRWLRQNHLIA